MKLPNIKILDEKNPILHKVSKEVTFPLDKDTKKLIDDTLTYLEMSQDEELAKKYNIRAGMGMSFVQLGRLERIFVVSEELEDGSFERHIVINPTIISHSDELIYVSEGEGCLSVNREVEGIVPRYARCTFRAYDIDGNEFTIRVREDISVAYQHELDHLNGILFVDKIDPKNPYKNKDRMREI